MTAAMGNTATKMKPSTYHPVRGWLIRHGRKVPWLAARTGIHAVSLNQYLLRDPEMRRTMGEEHATKIARAIRMSVEFVTGPNVTLGITTAA